MHVATTEVAVRYAETDQMGVVYHANYLVWMELGRTALVESLGFNYAAMEADGIVSPILEANVKYKKAMRYGDKATVRTWIEKYDGLRVVYGYEILDGNGDICVEAQTTNICVKKDAFRPVSLKRAYPDWHEAYSKASKNPA